MDKILMLVKKLFRKQTSVPKNKIDFSFITKMEGRKDEAYVPVDKDGKAIGQSGVTIGVGVDLSNPDIFYLNLPSLLKLKLKTYIGKKGQEAIDVLNARPLKLMDSEIDLLSNAIFTDIISDVITLFNKSSKTKFSELEAEKQTAIASVAYQYGARLDRRTPKFFKLITTGQWDKAVKELRNFGDAFPERRTKEADLMASSLNSKGDTINA